MSIILIKNKKNCKNYAEKIVKIMLKIGKLGQNLTFDLILPVTLTLHLKFCMSNALINHFSNYYMIDYKPNDR